MNKVRKWTDKWRLYCRLQKIKKTGGKMNDDVVRGLFYGAVLILCLVLVDLLNLPPIADMLVLVLVGALIFAVERPDIPR